MSAERQDAPEGGWGSLKVDELKDQLEARGLPKSGKKDELVARLDEHDAGGGAAEGDVTPAGEAAEQEGPAGGKAAAEAQDVEQAEGEAKPDAKPARRRGSAETSTGQRPASRRPDGAVVVRAHSRYVRSAPRKARLVMDHIRGKEVVQARAILTHAPRAVAGDILKLLNSAIANAESAYELAPDELRIMKAYVDEGPTIKRFRPRALGRATPIKKRTSHMTIELTTTANGR
ncbi:MAG: large subunit ribosomal protein [Thermoleophilaceae bacterium]|jgi:ribosomal protein L22|nr:large subunit ribosomal protein [Thermoleophilaceae bacterium]